MWVWEATTPSPCLGRQRRPNAARWTLLPRVLAPELTAMHLLLLLVCLGEQKTQKERGCEEPRQMLLGSKGRSDAPGSIWAPCIAAIGLEILQSFCLLNSSLLQRGSCTNCSKSASSFQVHFGLSTCDAYWYCFAWHKCSAQGYPVAATDTNACTQIDQKLV